MESIIKIKNLSKSFGEVKAVKNLSFEVRKGELFAFLGVNGAGKSTTISIMCGQLQKDSGSVIIDGCDLDSNIDSIKSEIGVVFQNSVLDQSLTVYDNLQIRAALYGINGNEFNKRLEELVELFDIGGLLKRTVGKLSGGQRRRVDIARALLNKPKILILDEPTTGLDPQTRSNLWSVIERLRERNGLTVFLTTHYMEEAVDADYVVILDNGKISAEGTPVELKNKFTGDFITLYNVNLSEIEQLGFPFEELKGAFKVYVPNTNEATKLIINHSDIFRDYEITKGKMDDVFLAATGKKLIGESENV